jgi:hypothetical protein
MNNSQQRREARETEKDIEFLVDIYWRLPSDALRQELNLIIEAADEVEREEFKQRLHRFFDRVSAVKASI